MVVFTTTIILYRSMMLAFTTTSILCRGRCFFIICCWKFL